MIIKVSTEVIAGTDRGGEDLFLVVEGEHKVQGTLGEDWELSCVLQKIDREIDALIGTLSAETPPGLSEEDWKEHLTKVNSYSLVCDGLRVGCLRTFHDFQYDKPVGEFRALVRSLMVDVKNWGAERKFGESGVFWRLKRSHFVGGNAE